MYAMPVQKEHIYPPLQMATACLNTGVNLETNDFGMTLETKIMNPVLVFFVSNTACHSTFYLTLMLI